MSLRSFIHQTTEHVNQSLLSIPLRVGLFPKIGFYWKGLLSLSIGLACLSVAPVALADLMFGDFGDDVSVLQDRLLDLGYDPGPVDGAYGPDTTAAVIQYQYEQGLDPDGIAGPQTLSALGLGYLVGIGGTSSLYPDYYGSISSWYGSTSSRDCGYMTGYLVAVPGDDLPGVRQYFGSACQDHSDRGSFVNAGRSYEGFSAAERDAEQLRELGFDARVYHRD